MKEGSNNWEFVFAYLLHECQHFSFSLRVRCSLLNSSVGLTLMDFHESFDQVRSKVFFYRNVWLQEGHRFVSGLCHSWTGMIVEIGNLERRAGIASEGTVLLLLRIRKLNVWANSRQNAEQQFKINCCIAFALCISIIWSWTTDRFLNFTKAFILHWSFETSSSQVLMVFIWWSFDSWTNGSTNLTILSYIESVILSIQQSLSY